MEWSKINRSQVLVFTSALLGFLLSFGGTDLSVFEVFAVIVGVLTICIVYRHDLYQFIPFTKQNYILLFFFVLVVFQMFLIPRVEPVFLAASVFLLAVYGVAQFWFSKESDTRRGVVIGYLVGVVFSSLVGAIAYFSILVRDSSERAWFFWEDNIRITAFFDDPNVYGAFLVPAILVFSSKAFFATKRNEYLLYLGLALLIFGNLILTGSRGAWLNLLIGAVVLLIIHRPLWTKEVMVRMMGVVTLSLIVATTVIFAVPLGESSYFSATLVHRHNTSDIPRLQNLQAAPERVMDRSAASVWLGSGSGTYEKNTGSGFSAHNTYLRVLYEQGFVGIALYLTFIIFAIRQAFKKRASQSIYNNVLTAALVGILVQGLFVDTLHWRHFWILVGLVL